MSRKCEHAAPPLGGAGFWKRFSRTAWGRRQALFESFTASPICTPAELFEFLLEASDRLRDDRGKKPILFRFFGDEFNAQIREDFLRYLPTRRDRDFTTYHARVTDQLGSREWGIALNDLHTYAPKLWTFARELAHGLCAEIGLPAGKISVESFIGPYRSTSFGIHKDFLHVFTLPVIGEKTMHLWPYAPLAKYLGLAGDQHLDIVNTPFRTSLPVGPEPIELRAGVGDLTYWPPEWWHVARGNGELTATIAIAVQSTALATDCFKRLVPHTATRLAPRHAKAHRAAIEREARAYAEALTSRAFVERLADDFHRKTSSHAFDPPVEKLERARVRMSDSVEVDPRFPIVAVAKRDTLDCFVNGHALSVTPVKAMAKLVARLNRGGRQSVASLCALARSHFHDEGYAADNRYILAFLTACASYRGLSTIG